MAVFFLCDVPSPASTAEVKAALQEIDKLGMIAMKKGESFNSHKQMDQAVIQIVSHFSTEDSLLELGEACMKKQKTLDCDVPKQMHCMAFMTAYGEAASKLAEMGTTKSLIALQKLSSLIAGNAAYTVFLQEDIERCKLNISRKAKR